MERDTERQRGKTKTDVGLENLNCLSEAVGVLCCTFEEKNMEVIHFTVVKSLGIPPNLSSSVPCLYRSRTLTISGAPRSQTLSVTHPKAFLYATPSIHSINKTWYKYPCSCVVQFSTVIPLDSLDLQKLDDLEIATNSYFSLASSKPSGHPRESWPHINPSLSSMRKARSCLPNLGSNLSTRKNRLEVLKRSLRLRSNTFGPSGVMRYLCNDVLIRLVFFTAFLGELRGLSMYPK